MPHLSDVQRDRAISQGIGASPLVGQAIQRQDIERNRSLSQALATARGTLAQQRQARQSRLARNVGRNVAAVRQATQTPRASTGGAEEIPFSFDPGRAGVQGSITLGRRDPTDPSALVTRRISIAEARRLNIVPESLPSITGFGAERVTSVAGIGDLASGIAQTSPGTNLRAAQQLLGQLRPGRPRRRGGLKFRLGGVRRKAKEAVGRPETGTTLLPFSLQKGITLEQNEKARVVSAGLTSFTRRIRSAGGTSEDAQLHSRLLNALRTGKGFKFLQEFSRLGGTI